MRKCIHFYKMEISLFIFILCQISVLFACHRTVPCCLPLRIPPEEHHHHHHLAPGRLKVDYEEYGRCLRKFVAKCSDPIRSDARYEAAFLANQKYFGAIHEEGHVSAEGICMDGDRWMMIGSDRRGEDEKRHIAQEILLGRAKIEVVEELECVLARRKKEEDEWHRREKEKKEKIKEEMKEAKKTEKERKEERRKEIREEIKEETIERKEMRKEELKEEEKYRKENEKRKEEIEIERCKREKCKEYKKKDEEKEELEDWRKEKKYQENKVEKIEKKESIKKKIKEMQTVDKEEIKKEEEKKKCREDRCIRNDN